LSARCSGKHWQLVSPPQRHPSIFAQPPAEIGHFIDSYTALCCLPSLHNLGCPPPIRRHRKPAARPRAQASFPCLARQRANTQRHLSLEPRSSRIPVHLRRSSYWQHSQPTPTRCPTKNSCYPAHDIPTMTGEAWLYLLAVLINAVNLFLQVFFTIMYSDLEW